MRMPVSFGFRISKRNRFGIYSKIENVCLNVLQLILTASFEIRNNKLLILNSARIKIEILKRLVRLMNELQIVSNKNYIEFESDLQEISKMTNGWIKYLRSPAWTGLLSMETTSRARRLSLVLSGLYQFTLSLLSFQFTFGTLPSELREPVNLPDSVYFTENLFQNFLR